MTNINEDTYPVVVGVDGSESALHAVRWAAREAWRRDAPLRLVHVCHLAPVRHPRQIPPPPEYRTALLEQGRHWLTEADDAARHAVPGLPVSTDLHDGIVADVLVTESKTAQLMVLGSRGLGGFVSRCTAFVANDSGPLHIARALGVPTLAIFGSTDPGMFDFAGHALLFAGVECAPCSFFGRTRCPRGHFRCMLDLTEERAWEALAPLLRAGRRLPLSA